MRCLLGLALFAEEPEDTGSRRFGDYDIEGEIARGGMGIVYRARQRSLNRPVAIKKIVGGELASTEAVQRFQLEAETVARLRHPNIVSIHEVGEFENERFFAMELVTGGSLADKCQRGPKDVATLIAKVARALAFAHEHGVLHRDVKPSNILLDENGEPRLSDFGLAKLTTGEQSLTHSSAMLGSPGYMAPEQAANAEATTASDVYGLGAVLYYLLAGRPPFNGRTAVDTLRCVIEEPPAPLPASVPRDLATICLKCLEKPPLARYASARDLADDLGRYLRDEVILARPVAGHERLLRWARRRPLVALLAVTTALSLIIGATAVFLQWRKAEHAAAEQARSLQHLHWKQVGDWLEKGDSAQALAYLATQIRARPEDWRPAMYAMSIVDNAAFPMSAGPVIYPGVKLTKPARLSPAGDWIAAACEDNAVRVWRVATGDQIACITLGAPVTALAAGSGGEVLAIATEDGALFSLSALTAKPGRIAREASFPVQALAFSADGRVLMARSKDQVELHGASHQTLKLPGLAGAELAANGERFLMWSPKTAVISDTATGEERLRMEAEGKFSKGDISVNAARVALVDAGKGSRVETRSFDVLTQREFPRIENKPQRWRSLTLNTDGSRVTLGGSSTELFVFDVESGLRVSSLMSGSFYHHTHVVSADGRSTASYGLGGTIQLWNADDGQALMSAARIGNWNQDGELDIARDGSVVLLHAQAVKGWPEHLATVRSTHARPARRYSIPGSGFFDEQYLSPDGRIAGIGLWPEPRCYIFETATRRVLLDKPALGGVYAILFSPDGERCYAMTVNGWLHGWSLRSGEPLWQPRQQPGAVRPGAISADGRFIVAGHADGHVRIYDTSNGDLVRTLDHPGEIKSLRFAFGSSTRFVSAGTDNVARLWDLPGGTLLQTFRGHTHLILSTAWSHDGRFIATASYDTTARIWDTATGAEVCPPIRHTGSLSHLEFSPDGRQLVTVTRDGIACLWNAATGEPLINPIAQGWSCDVVRFTADGAAFMVRDLNGFCFYDSVRGEPVTRYYPEPLASGLGMDSQSVRNIMTPDGTQVFLSYSMDDAALWTIQQPRRGPPEWFADFIEALAFVRLDQRGTQSGFSPEALRAVRQRITGDDEFARWAKRVTGE